MSRSPSIVLSLTFAIQPGGWALPADPASVWGKMLLPMATTWSAIEVSMEAMLPQVDPRNAVELLPDWQRMLGPDPCGRDLLVNSFGQEQQLAYQRLTARGGQSIPYFLSLAAAFGETATIQEANWSRCGTMRAGSMRATAQGNQFNWLVTLPSVDVVLFRAGSGRAGQRIGSFNTSLAVCPITNACPAHTNVGFSFASVLGGRVELEDASGLIALEDGGNILQETNDGSD